MTTELIKELVGLILKGKVREIQGEVIRMAGVIDEGVIRIDELSEHVNTMNDLADDIGEIQAQLQAAIDRIKSL